VKQEQAEVTEAWQKLSLKSKKIWRSAQYNCLGRDLVGTIFDKPMVIPAEAEEEKSSTPKYMVWE
jgi:hypothetical protein